MLELQSKWNRSQGAGRPSLMFLFKWCIHLTQQLSCLILERGRTHFLWTHM